MSIFSTRAILASTAAVMSIFTGACATITRGTTQDVVFQSEPPGAAMETTHGFRCTTPCTLELQRADSFVASFTLPGYQTQEVPVTSGMSGGGAAGLAGNIIFGGVIGGAIDATSGAMNDLTPSPVMVTLAPAGAAPAVAAAAAPVEAPVAAPAAVASSAE